MSYFEFTLKLKLVLFPTALLSRPYYSEICHKRYITKKIKFPYKDDSSYLKLQYLVF